MDLLLIKDMGLENTKRSSKSSEDAQFTGNPFSIDKYCKYDIIDYGTVKSGQFLSMTAGELEMRIRESASEIGFAAGKIEAVEVEGEKNIFRLSGSGGRGLWAKVAGRAKICNICQH